MKEQQEKYNLPESWIWTTIDEIGIVASGGTPSTKNREFWGGDISWITPADLSNYKGKFIARGSRNISQLGLDHSSARLIPKGSVLFSSRAPIGYVVIAQNDLTTSQGFKNLIPMIQVDSEYIYYYFLTLKSQAEKVASGTTFLELSTKNFSKLPFPLCPLNEQRLIVYTKMGKVLFPELQETTGFGEYNLRELRQFYALFFLNFHFIRWTEAVLDSKTGQNLSFGSNPLYLSPLQFEKLASTITGLSRDVAKAIILDLTFNPNSFHTSVTIQPFVLSSSGTYYILPNLFSQLEPSRMILGALNKGAKKKIYDKLINLIEKFNLNELYLSIANIGNWISYLEKVIKFNGKQIHPDLILIDVVEKSICVIDYKHFIGPITASEVDYKMNELKKGMIQVQNYIDALSKLNKIGVIDIEGFAIDGLLITHKPMPVPITNEIDIPVTDMATFTQKVKSINSQGLNELVQLFAVNEKPKNVFTAFESEIAVGEWRVIRSQHKIINAN